ncbi:MAG: MiaB/RimO family radical SAM methylthiotransferase, partial [Bacteroidota bacterium]
KMLESEGFKEITLLGQNVNSYVSPDTGEDFADLLSTVAKTVPNMRIRFTTSHPKDISDKLIITMAENKNICKHLHLPVQSGSNKILKLMNRKYTVEHYLERINKIREILPDCSLTTDLIAGFPTESIEDHQGTLDILQKARYDGAFMFRYSPREGTKAYDLADDVPEDEKIRRLNEIIALQNTIALDLNKAEIGRIHEVLAEGPSKRNKSQWQGRTDTNKVVIFPIPDKIRKGDILKVQIKRYTSATLFGEIIL